MSKIAVEHAQRFYLQLLQRSKPYNEKEDSWIDGVKPKAIFTGRLTDEWAECQISKSFYTKARHTLIVSGTIAIVQQGRRNTDSIVHLFDLAPPDVLERNIPKAPLTDAGRIGILAGTTEGHGERITALEEKLGEINLTDYFRKIELRLVKLESLLTEKPTTGVRRGNAKKT
jgi:hypothetical protein